MSDPVWEFCCFPPLLRWEVAEKRALSEREADEMRRLQSNP